MRRYFVVILAALSLSTQAWAADDLARAIQSRLNSVCFLLTSSKKSDLGGGTATVVASNEKRSWLLTARHVIRDLRGGDCVFLGGASYPVAHWIAAPGSGFSSDWGFVKILKGNLPVVPLTTRMEWGEQVAAITMADMIPFAVFAGRVARPIGLVPGSEDVGLIALFSMTSAEGASGALVLNDKGEGIAVLVASYIYERKRGEDKRGNPKPILVQQILVVGAPLAPAIEMLEKLVREEPE